MRLRAASLPAAALAALALTAAGCGATSRVREPDLVVSSATPAARQSAPAARQEDDRASIDSLGGGVRNFRRRAFEDDQAALLGALSGPQPVTKALAAAIAGETSPAAAARRAQADVERIQESLAS